MGQVYNLVRNSAMELSRDDGTPRLSPPWQYSDGGIISSMNSRFIVNMCFTNRTSNSVELFWINFSGEECSYGIIEPGATYLLYTYLSHPWVFRNKANLEEVMAVNGKMVAWPSQHHTFADILEPPKLQWSTATHASDFRKRAPGFARDVRNLLLAYYSQRKPSSSCRGSRGGSAGAQHSIQNKDVTGAAEATAVSGSYVRKLWNWRGHDKPVVNNNVPQPTWASRFTASAAAAATALCYGIPGATSSPLPPSSSLSSSSHRYLGDQRLNPEAQTPLAPPSSPQPHHQHHGPQHPQEQELEEGLLGKLPFDLILEIIAHMAPPLPELQPVYKDDVELMPHGVQPELGPVAQLAAQMLGPVAPQPPQVDPAAWFAVAAAGLGGGAAAGAAAANPAAGAGGGAAGAEGGAQQAPLAAMAAAAAAAAGPLGMGAVAPMFPAHILGGEGGVPQAPGLGFGHGPQLLPQPGAEGGNAPDANGANAAQLQELLRYMEALALANAAYTRVDAMIRRQQEEAPILTARIRAQAQARERQQQQQQAPQEGGDAAAVQQQPLQQHPQQQAAPQQNLPPPLEQVVEQPQGLDQAQQQEWVAFAQGGGIPWLGVMELAEEEDMLLIQDVGVAADGEDEGGAVPAVEVLVIDDGGAGDDAADAGEEVLEQFYSAPEEAPPSDEDMAA